MRFKEKDLEILSGCPLYRGPAELDRQVYSVCYDSLTWALLQNFNHDGITLNAIMKKVETSWIKCYKRFAGVDRAQGNRAFHEGLRKARLAIRRIFHLATHYDVYRPVSSYQYITDGHSINGEYPLLRGRRDGCATRILVPSFRNAKKLGFDLVGISRWLDVRRTHPEVTNLILVYAPLLSGELSYKHIKDESLATQYLSAAVRVLNARIKANYPVPTLSLCRSCAEKGCQNLVAGTNPQKSNLVVPQATTSSVFFQ